VLRLPDDGVSVEVSGGVEPEIELLLSVPLAFGKHVCVENVRVTAHVSQEFKINLIMSWPLRRQLHTEINTTVIDTNTIQRMF